MIAVATEPISVLSKKVVEELKTIAIKHTLKLDSVVSLLVYIQTFPESADDLIQKSPYIEVWNALFLEGWVKNNEIRFPDATANSFIPQTSSKLPLSEIGKIWESLTNISYSSLELKALHKNMAIFNGYHVPANAAKLIETFHWLFPEADLAAFLKTCADNLKALQLADSVVNKSNINEIKRNAQILMTAWIKEKREKADILSFIYPAGLNITKETLLRFKKEYLGIAVQKCLDERRGINHNSPSMKETILFKDERPF